MTDKGKFGKNQDGPVVSSKPDEVQLWKEKYLRALADYQNLEKWVAQKRQEDSVYASKKIIEKLLDVLDTLEMSARNLKDTGVNLAIKGFNDLLKTEGVTRIDVMGKKFDPIMMECTQVEGEGDEVSQEVRPGYLMGDKIIRVARVKVGKKKNINKVLSS